MRPHGFTVVELLVTLAVAALLLSLAAPAFNDLRAGVRSSAVANRMAGAVAYARAQSILRRRPVTLCPGRVGCLGRDQWHEGALIFVDDNGNGSIDGAERIDRALPPLRGGERVYWRAFRSKSYLQFQPRGYTAWQNGTFLYCPEDGDPRFARLVIVNAQGRARMGRDADGDGIVETASGLPARCP